MEPSESLCEDNATGRWQVVELEAVRRVFDSSNEDMPEHGVPFTAILTLYDPFGVQPVFNDLRQTLLALGVQIADIRTAARITPRV